MAGTVVYPADKGSTTGPELLGLASVVEPGKRVDGPVSSAGLKE